LTAFEVEKGIRHTHRCDTDERGAYASVKTSSQTITSNTLANNIDGGGVNTSLSGLKADLDKVERMAYYDSAKTTETTSRKGAKLLGEARGCAGLGVSFWFRSGRNGLELVYDTGLDGGVWGIGGGHYEQFGGE
jgi:hypothetical protein